LTPLLARLRQAARWVWALLIPVGAALAYVFYVRRRIPRAEPLDAAIARARRQVDIANAKAAVEIEAARTTNKAEQAELLEALRHADEDEQIDRLIEVGRRIRERR
jgi:hypothetical protein